MEGGALPSLQDRNDQVMRYLPMVRAMAEKLRNELPPAVETDDLVTAGVFGLMDAMKRYDPSQGVKFITFCATRLRGAMIDELRALDMVPRAIRIRARAIEEKYRELESSLQRAPRDEELAEATGLSVHELVVTLEQAAGNAPVSLSQPSATDGDLADWALSVMQDKRAPQPADVVHREEVRKLVQAVVNSLPRLERLVVVLYYYEQLTMKQVGEVLSLSESRVCQIHSDVMHRLQQRLRAHKADFFGPSS